MNTKLIGEALNIAYDLVVSEQETVFDNSFQEEYEKVIAKLEMAIAEIYKYRNGGLIITCRDTQSSLPSLSTTYPKCL